MVRKKKEPASPRARILEAAERELLEKGPDDLSLRGVARRAGYSPASLYEHFESREAILQALATAANAALHERMEAAAAAAPAGEEALVAIGEAYVRFAHEESAPFLVLFQRLQTRRVSPEQAPLPGSAAGLLRSTVEAAVAARGRKNLDVDRIAWGLWALSHGIAMLTLGHLAGFEADLRGTTAAVLRPAIRGWLGGEP